MELAKTVVVDYSRRTYVRCLIHWRYALGKGKTQISNLNPGLDKWKSQKSKSQTWLPRRKWNSQKSNRQTWLSVVSRGADGLEVLLLVDERLKLKLKGEKKSNGLSKRIIRVRYYVDKCGWDGGVVGERYELSLVVGTLSSGSCFWESDTYVYSCVKYGRGRWTVYTRRIFYNAGYNIPSSATRACRTRGEYLEVCPGLTNPWREGRSWWSCRCTLVWGPWSCVQAYRRCSFSVWNIKGFGLYGLGWEIMKKCGCIWV